MQFSTLALAFGLTLSVLAAPSTIPVRRAAAVLRAQDYNQFSVSDGVGGNALAEVNARFPIDLNNLTGVAKSDLDILKKAAQVSGQAEVAKGGFNDAIAAAGGIKTTQGAMLQVGKIKNKVLKMQTDVLRIKIGVAQGSNDGSTLATQQAKLDANVASDVANKDKISQGISFSG